MGLRYQLLDGRLQNLIRALRSARPVLLHTHGYKANIMGRAAALVTGTPVAASFHAGLREPFPVSFYQRLDEFTSFAGGRIAVSEPIARSLPYRAEFLDNFISAPPAPASPALPRAVAFVGRLTHEKGFDLFCEIAAKAASWRTGAIASPRDLRRPPHPTLSPRGEGFPGATLCPRGEGFSQGRGLSAASPLPGGERDRVRGDLGIDAPDLLSGVEWHVYGDGPLRAQFENTHPFIRFHGFTAALDEVWPRIGLLLMPSRAEGLPMAAIEALSHGVPVAASRVGGLPRAIVPGVISNPVERSASPPSSCPSPAIPPWRDCHSRLPYPQADMAGEKGRPKSPLPLGRGVRPESPLPLGRGLGEGVLSGSGANESTAPGMTGWLFEAGDTGAACEAVRSWSALDSGQQAALRQACWRHAVTNYSAGAVLPRLLELYARQAPAFRHILQSLTSSRL